MSLGYFYEFTASPATLAGELEDFLRGVEQLAKSLGLSSLRSRSYENFLFETMESIHFRPFFLHQLLKAKK